MARPNLSIERNKEAFTGAAYAAPNVENYKLLSSTRIDVEKCLSKRVIEMTICLKLRLQCLAVVATWIPCYRKSGRKTPTVDRR